MNATTITINIAPMVVGENIKLQMVIEGDEDAHVMTVLGYVDGRVAYRGTFTETQMARTTITFRRRGWEPIVMGCFASPSMYWFARVKNSNNLILEFNLAWPDYSESIAVEMVCV